MNTEKRVKTMTKGGGYLVLVGEENIYVIVDWFWFDLLVSSLEAFYATF